MKIELATDQYESLVKIVYLGNWLANAIRNGSEDDPRLGSYEKIEQYIFSFAQEAGFGKWIEYDKKYRRFFPTRAFEDLEEIQTLIEDYDEENFWDELLHRLSDRDFFRSYSVDEIKSMEMLERFEKEEPFREKWDREIDEHGLERLDVAH